MVCRSIQSLMILVKVRRSTRRSSRKKPFSNQSRRFIGKRTRTLLPKSSVVKQRCLFISKIDRIYLQEDRLKPGCKTAVVEEFGFFREPCH